jgi:hypothetical protein
MNSTLRTVNRVLLALFGALLLALGLAVLAGGLEGPRQWGLELPSGWPWRSPDAVLLSDADRTRWRSEGWWWPVVFAALGVLVVLLLWWLLVQLRRSRLSTVLVETDDGEGALLRGRALENVLAAEAESLSGVDRVSAALTGRRTQPRVRVGMRLEPHAEPGPAVRQLTGGALAHARASASLDRLPAEVRLRAMRHRAERAL